MITFINLYSDKIGELNTFLSSFYNSNFELYDNLMWKKEFANPVEITELIGVFIDNIDDFSISMWLCLDEDFYINITKDNANAIIKYIFERFP